MQNKRGMQKAWVMTNWDLQMQAVQDKLQRFKTVRTAKASKQLLWRVIYDASKEGK